MKTRAPTFSRLFLIVPCLFLSILPISAQTVLTTLWTWPGYDLGYGRGIAVRPPLAYLASAEGGLHILDVSNPSRPLWTGNVGGGAVRFSAIDVALSDDGTIAYVARAEGLEVIDVADPAQPQLLESYLPEGGFTISSVVIRDHLAYVSDTGFYGLRILDLTQPREPKEIGSCLTQRGGNALTLSGNLVLQAVDERGLRVIDVSNPVEPVLLGVGPAENLSGGAVTVAGNQAYVAEYWGGLLVFDFGTPAQATLTGAFKTGREILEVQTRDALAFVVAGAYGLALLDLNASPVPNELSHLELGGRVAGLAITNQLVLLAAGQAGLRIVDVQDPTQPITVGTWNDNPPVSDVALMGHYAVVAGLGSGVHVIDFSNPAAPRRVGRYATAGEAYVAVVAGNLAFVGDHGQGLVILDLTDPSAPAELAVYPTMSTVLDIRVDGSLAYLLEASVGVERVDVRDPRQPQRQAFLSLWGPLRAFDVRQTEIYLALDYGIQVYDVTDWANPQGLDSWSDGPAVHVLPYDQGLLVCRGFDGLSGLGTSQPTGVRLALGSVSPPGTVQLLVEGTPGQTLEIQRSPDLSQWETMGASFLLEGASAEWFDPAPSPASPTFYRALVY